MSDMGDQIVELSLRLSEWKGRAEKQGERAQRAEDLCDQRTNEREAWRRRAEAAEASVAKLEANIADIIEGTINHLRSRGDGVPGKRASDARSGGGAQSPAPAMMVSTPGVLGGAWRISGTRISVACIKSFSDLTAEEIRVLYPILTLEQIEAARAFEAPDACP